MMNPLIGVGALIGKRPNLILWVTFFTILPICSYYLFFPFVIKTDIRRGFAHKNGDSHKEFQIFGDFYNISINHMEIIGVLVKGLNGSRLPITSDVIDAIDKLDKFVENYNYQEHNRTITIKDLFTSRGSFNFLYHAFKLGYDIQQFNVLTNSSLASSIDLTFPNSNVFGHTVFMGTNFFGVQLHPNNTYSPSKIKDVETIALWFMMQANSDNDYEMMKKMELNLYNHFLNNKFSNHCEVKIYGDEVANLEMLKASLRTNEMLIFGIIAMILYMLYVFKQIPFSSQVVLVVAAIASPAIASLLTFSMMGWLDVSLNTMMCITPFLILGIGVDDAFLLFHCYQKNSMILDKGQRMKKAVMIAGPSIAITSLTNTLAFGIGIMSPASQMSNFCICTAIAVFADFILEFVIFAPFLVIVNTDIKRKQHTPLPTNFSSNNQTYWKTYTTFIVSSKGKCCAFVLIVVLYTTAFLGITNMESSFEPKKTFPQDAQLIKVLDNLEDMYSQYAPITFIVNRPPDVANKTDLDNFMALVQNAEAFPEAYPKERTQLWLREYIDYFNVKHNHNLRADQNVTSLNYDLVPTFLIDNFMDDKNIVKWHHKDGKVYVDGFVFLVIAHGKRGWHDRAHMLQRLRNLLLQYSTFNTTVYDYDATIFDLILTVPQELTKAVLLTVGCMTIVCFLIIPDIETTGLAILSVSSISFTLIGALGLLGQDMDPVTMVNVLMAIGFSVDYAAHICSHYYKLKKKALRNGMYIFSPKQKQEMMSNVFSFVGMPMIEAAFSTIICMLPLFLVKVPIVMTFAQTVCLVSSIGTLHGLFITPCLLTINLSSLCSKPHMPIQKPIIGLEPKVEDITLNGIKTPSETSKPTPAKKTKRAKSPNHPKRSLSAFFFWLQENRERIKGQKAGMGVSDVAKVAGLEWNKLTDKKRWEKKAEEDKKRYERDLEAYKNKQITA
uniref:SSD domain-containing protein n=1 Tax=Rhabditophanes sp. KR3021 TaxID=114890 RepID=A0AC35TYS7_9BILA